MQKSTIVLLFVFVTNILLAQNVCTDVNKILDSVHYLNSQMKKLNNDSTRVRQFVKNYRGLNLLGDTATGLSIPAVIFSIPPEYADSVGTCLLQRAKENNWHISWKKKDKNGFQGFNFYKSPDKKNRILYFISNPLTRRIDLAIPIEW